MDNEDMAGRIMAHAFHDELEKVALRKLRLEKTSARVPRKLLRGPNPFEEGTEAYVRFRGAKKLSDRPEPSKRSLLLGDKELRFARDDRKARHLGMPRIEGFYLALMRGEGRRSKKILESLRRKRDARRSKLEKTSSSQILRSLTSAAGRSMSRGSRLPAPKVNLPKGSSYGDLFGDAPRPKVPAVKKKPSSMYNFGDYPAGTPGLVRPK